jgi:hypothetical protein
VEGTLKNKYTVEDIKVLHRMSTEGSVLKHKLAKWNFSPERFEELLNLFPHEKEIVFNYPYEDLPLKIDDASINGYLQWRLAIGK